MTILMTGGELNGRHTELADDPLLQSGDEILIFCKQNTDGAYRIISGPQGRLVYSDGKLNSLNVTNERVKMANSASNITVLNVDANTLINQLKVYIGKK